MSFWAKSTRAIRTFIRSSAPSIRKIQHFRSEALDRDVHLDIYLPPGYRAEFYRSYPLLVLNDGQDLPRMGFSKILKSLYEKGLIPYLIVVGIHANEQRTREYGTARQADFKGRGDKAGLYKEFIVSELLPFLLRKYRLSGSVEETAFAGFSLGGLSAFDIAWSLPEIFGAVGVFSGALWWRWAPIDPNDPDACRIMHDIVQKTPKLNEGQRFWFQTGTLDEEDDRNNNGIIDAIDDTLDLIRELEKKGCPDALIRYLEIENGTHDPQTWGLAMPDFLVWAFSSGWRYAD